MGRVQKDELFKIHLAYPQTLPEGHLKSSRAEALPV